MLFIVKRVLFSNHNKLIDYHFEKHTVSRQCSLFSHQIQDALPRNELPLQAIFLGLPSRRCTLLDRFAIQPTLAVYQ